MSITVYILTPYHFRQCFSADIISYSKVNCLLAFTTNF
jgi:hypothetical protein